jgi:hypothetical protein
VRIFSCPAERPHECERKSDRRHCIPDRGRSLAFQSQTAKIELRLPPIAVPIELQVGQA